MIFTSKLVGFMVASSIAGALAAIVDCGSANSCLRYSDCDNGYTCASGLCVVAPVESGDGGDDDGSTAVSSVEDASSTTTSDGGTAVTFDSSTGTSDDAGADAGDSSVIADASTD